MQVKAAEAEATALDGLLDQRVGSMTGEAHLPNSAAGQCPVDQLCPITGQSPVEMLLPVDAMDRQVLKPGTIQPFQAGIKGSTRLVEGLTGKQFAGDDPVALCRRGARLIQLLERVSQKSLRWTVGRCCLGVVDSGVAGAAQHRLHLLR